MKRLFLGVAVLLSLLISCTNADKSELKVTGGEGEMWLHWSALQRDAFMEGYVRALVHGYALGCDAGMRATSSLEANAARLVSESCAKRNPASGKDFTGFADRVTQFYSEFPNSRALPISKVIDGFLEGQTAADIAGADSKTLRVVQ